MKTKAFAEYEMASRRRNVTIAAGILCSDGIVLCADTEQTDYTGKYQREKVFNFDNKLLLTGAGTSDYIKLAFDKLCDSYRAMQPPNPAAARLMVEEVVLDISREHILPFFSEGQRPTFDLIIAMRCSDGSPVMVKTQNTIAVLGGFFESVGVGKPLFEYWAQLLYHPNLKMNIVNYICAFILQEVKQNVYACGGHSFVMGLPNDASRTGNHSVYRDGSIFGGFPATVIPVLLKCRDMETSDAEFESAIEEFLGRVRLNRQQERQLVNMTEIAKYSLPLPDASLGTEEATRLIQASKRIATQPSASHTSTDQQ
jgi:hypothetical protein